MSAPKLDNKGLVFHTSLSGITPYRLHAVLRREQGHCYDSLLPML